MEDFLKDRPVIAPADAAGALQPAASSSLSAPDAGAAALAALPQIRRAAAAAAASAAGDARGASAASALFGASGGAANQTHTGDHGVKVQTIVERGRVTKIVVTCTCGQVTEIACTY